MKYVPTTALQDLRDQLHSKALVDWNSKVSCDGMVVHLNCILDTALDAVPVAELEKIRAEWLERFPYADTSYRDALRDCYNDLGHVVDPPPATLRSGEEPA